jgi:hypothetical protein
MPGVPFRSRARGDIVSRTAVAVVLLLIAGLAHWHFAPAGWLFSHRERPIPPEGIPGGPGGGHIAATVDPSHNPPLYKWKDPQGQWHITDKPPAKGIEFEKVVVDPNANVVPTEIPVVPGHEEKKDESKK